jgi:hypothetical protein
MPRERGRDGVKQMQSHNNAAIEPAPEADEVLELAPDEELEGLIAEEAD